MNKIHKLGLSSTPNQIPVKNAVLLTHLLLVLVVTFTVICGFEGLDFGYHWDEPQTLRSVQWSIETGVLLPSLYLYPGVNFLVPMTVFLPSAARAVITREAPPDRADLVIADYDSVSLKPPTGTTLDRLQRGLQTIARSKQYLLQVRAVYLILSLLVSIWTYIIVLRWRCRPWEALLAASLIAMSWEFAYHARWVTPDALMTSFVMLSLMCACAARAKPRSEWWLRAAAVAAGLACGTKYQGAIAIFPVLITAHMNARDLAIHDRPWKVWSHLVILFAVTYLITTPGTLLDPLRFSHDLLFQLRTYSSGWEDHTIARGPMHFSRLIAYFGLSAFSHYIPISAAVFALALLGGVTVVREDRWGGLVLVGLPGVYALYMAMQRVMFVRNDLVVLPFLAILAARGASCILDWVRRWPLAQALLASLLCVFLAFNALWLWRAAETIRTRQFARYRYPMQLLDYTSHHGDVLFALSPKVSDELAGLTRSQPANIVSTLDSARYGVLYASEITNPSTWDATHYDYTHLWFGTDEVNFNYYPSWKGEDRIVMMDARYAKRLGLFDVHDGRKSSQSP